MIELLLIILLLVACNAFFALSEMSVVTSRKPRLKQMAADQRSAQKALELAEHPERFLSTVQVGITLVGILSGMLVGDALGEEIAARVGSHLPVAGAYAGTIGKVVAVGLITYVTIVLGELVPKRLALLAPERLASLVAVPMHWLSRIATPAVWLLSASVRGLLRLMRLGDSEAAQVTEEEIRLLVSESHEQGVIDADERNMMNRVMRLGDRTAESLMTPRTDIAWLDAAGSLADNLAVMQETPFARYPVYRGSDSDVAGTLEVKTLLDELGKDTPELFRDIRPPLFVSESTHALKLVEILREEQQSMALVVDEYGDIQGIVTITDIMDAVLGRLQAGEADGDEALVVERQDGSLLVDGGLHIDELRELTGERLADAEEHDYHTAAGLVIAHYGRIPHVGEHFQLGLWRVEVVDLDGPRIDKLLLQRMPDARDGSDGES